MTSSTGTSRLADPSDAGSGTVWVLISTMLLIAAVAPSFLLLDLRVLRAQAATAADLAALAAASAVPDHVDPCAAARAVAEAQQTVLISCSLDGPVVDVVVARPWPGRFAAFPEVRVRSRAGPPGAP
ncbi:MAG TPA: Rv3654c family TadE-like protein [Candidatus Limnocylindria bacterium]|nr:Rv3654c family TadE-like protein [Candidatus Limnocylindria bacterium]